MMAFDFPAAPAENQQYTPAGGPTYQYNAPAWRVLAPANSNYVLKAGDRMTGTLFSDADVAIDGLYYEQGHRLVRKDGDTLTGDLTVSKTTPQLILTRTSDTDPARLIGQTGALKRWQLTLGDNQSNLGITRFDDAGSVLDSPLTIARSTGLIVLAKGQLQFPATVNLSTDPNTLDDYKEGAFVPDLRFGNVATGFTYTRREGRYVKIGSSVRWWAGIKLSAKGSGSGVFTMAGLPYTSRPMGSDGVTYFASNVGYFNVMATAIAGLYTIVPSNGVSVNFYHVVAAGGVSVTQTNETMVGAALQLELSGSYETNS